MSESTESSSADHEILAHLGPLAALAGTWEGQEGIDIAPAKDGSKETPFRERITFEPMGPVVNGPQTLYGLRYSTVAWPLGFKNSHFTKRWAIGCGMLNENRSCGVSLFLEESWSMQVAHRILLPKNFA